ncbi:MAG: alpha-galactosidase [Candidatus Omnitrophica bacterium]|nr:alpha-galactosidase [Candidatus Omnitrophota bacterium]
MKLTYLSSVIVACSFFTWTPASLATKVTPGELGEANRWVSAKLMNTQEASKPEPGLTVLANNDPVQRNARGGKPLRIVNAQYTRGLYCHAVSKVVVRLPGPGKRLSAIAGVDSNDQTSGGRGSIIFSVNANGKELFRSAVMHEGMAGVPVNVDLDNAAEFTLEVGDAGDGIGCDQADWADAKVELADGGSVWLGDLPILGQGRGPYTAEPAFSFKYDNRASQDFMKDWKTQRETRPLDEHRTQITDSYTDPQTGLLVRCVAIQYRDFPTVEWTLYFKNTGSQDTPILSDIQALDTRFERNAEGEFVLHHNTGSPCTPTDYEPFATPMPPNSVKRISAAGGRPSNSDWPYFDLQWPSEGVIVVIGWPGQWAAQFQRDPLNGMRVRGGQELTHFILHPGEEVRSPLVVLQFYQGDWIRAQNIWRRWMLAYNLPRQDGALPPLELAACSSHQYGEMIHANRDNQIMFVDRYLEEGLKLDYWWMDAGWYVNNGGWPNTGTWEVDTNRFPGGLRAITDHAHSKGVKCIVWFEPERVDPGTWLYQHDPSWLLGSGSGDRLLNLGNPETRQWLTDHVDKLIREQGIDLYRNDFNIDPLGFWRANDAPDRQGITEIRYVTGYLAYWDELRRRHPNMLIDSCASGGRRNDLETMRRAVPLLRSDYILEPVSQQLHTYGIAFWLPFYGTGINSTDPYVFRSQMCPHATACYDMRNRQTDYAQLRRLYNQWRQVGNDFFGDYYPLTPYRVDNDVWMAWQFDCPEKGQGMVEAFRRANSDYEVAQFKLKGLDPDRRYQVTNFDESFSVEMTGSELLENGLRISIPQRPGAALIEYRCQP